jgi:hypothetical protein
MKWWHDVWMKYHSNRIKLFNQRFNLSGAYDVFKKIDEHEKKFKKHSAKVYK